MKPSLENKVTRDPQENAFQRAERLPCRQRLMYNVISDFKLKLLVWTTKLGGEVVGQYEGEHTLGKLSKRCPMNPHEVLPVTSKTPPNSEARTHAITAFSFSVEIFSMESFIVESFDREMFGGTCA